MDRGADRLRQPRRLCTVDRRAKDPDPDWREFLWPPRLTHRVAEKGVRPCHAGFHAHWRCDRLVKSSAIAGAAGIPMSTHLYPEVAAHVMRVTETAHWLEWQDWADPVLQRPYEIRDGLLHIPDVPGVGLEWNEDAVAANLANL